MQLRNIALLSALAIAVCTGSVMAGADTGDPTTPVQAGSRLQVTGNQKQFSIEADHADILSALQALFVQAGKQFDADKGVIGQITLKLNTQSFDTVLASICRQTLIKYHVDAATSIYHFEQDTEAENAAIKHLDTLDSLMRQQLRIIGLEVPADQILDSVAVKSAGSGRATGQKLSAGAGSGGLGGANGSRPDGQATASNRAAQVPGALNGVQAPADAGGQAANGQARGGGVPPQGQVGDRTKASLGGRAENGYKDHAIDVGSLSGDDLIQLLMATGGELVNAPTPQGVDKAYELYLRQNNLVAINTQGAPKPVSDVIAEIGRQAGVRILLDPSVPRGPKFRITLALPPCSLTEALNLILPPARLHWRSVNDMIYVTPTPEFQIFYGSAPIPYYNYGQNANSLRQNTGQGQGGFGGQNSGQPGGSPH